MSEQDLINELPSADFVPEEPQEQPRSQMSELLEIFGACKDRDEAMQKMKNGLQNVSGEEKYEGKYTIANCRKAIKRLKDRGMFKTSTPTIEAKDLTYKMDTPTIEPETPPTQQTPESFTEQIYTPTPTQPPYTPETQQPTQPKEYVEPPSCMVRSCTGMAKTGFKVVPHVLASDKESLEELKEIWAIPKEDLEELGFEFANLLKSLGVSPEIASGGNALAKVLGPLGASWKHIEKKFLGGKQ